MQSGESEVESKTNNIQSQFEFWSEQEYNHLAKDALNRLLCPINLSSFPPHKVRWRSYVRYTYLEVASLKSNVQDYIELAGLEY